MGHLYIPPEAAAVVAAVVVVVVAAAVAKTCLTPTATRRLLHCGRPQCLL